MAVANNEERLRTEEQDKLKQEIDAHFLYQQQ
jgi:hypothetical protein